jgi:hypothetical protein
VRCLVFAALALGACGDDAPPNIVAQLRALPGVTVEEKPTATTGYRYLVLHFTQPVDHDDPGGAKFQQQVSLLHKDQGAPLVVFTSGYWDYVADNRAELTRLLGANQISIEHRFFSGSRPEPPDWTKLTIAQMAADEHAIVTALRTIYTGTAIASGGSKGGMTAVYYRRFFPNDVDGTVPYVAPLSFGAPDLRYAPYLDTIGPPTCHQAVRDAAAEMLVNRRAAIEMRAQADAVANRYSYTRIALGPAVESAIDSLEWTFWQYRGITFCGAVPRVTASDDAMWRFLEDTSPPSDSDDSTVGAFDAYVYQAYAQLGFPDGCCDAYLKPFLIYTDADYAGAFPTAQPAYDGGAAMHDIDDFVQHSGDRLVFVYGEWDPWSGGSFSLGNAQESLELVEAQGTHDSDLVHLAAGDRQAAFDLIARWTGVTPVVPIAREETPLPRPPRVPPAIIRALRAR